MIIDISTKIGTTSNQGGFKGLLDVYSGAAAAYSLRKLSKATTSVVRVRRSSDNAEADFTAQEIIDGTLQAWVNADIVKYTSDFTSTENLFESNGTGAAAQSVAGVNDAYKFTLSGGSTTHLCGIFSLQAGVAFTVEFDYYIPSGQTVDAIRFRNLIANTDFNTLDSWTSVSISTTSSLSNDAFWQSLASGNATVNADGDVFYLKNIVVTQTTADGLVTTWYDQSGNANNATQATAASQPQIVSAGSIITDSGYQVIQYDGTDDTLSTSFTATGTMLMGGADGGAFYEVAISGAYNLLAQVIVTDHPLKESIRVIWGRTLSAGEQSAIESRVTYSDWDFSDVTNFYRYWRQRSELTSFPLIDTSNGTTFEQTWHTCNSLTSFPLIDTSNGSSFFESWRSCTSLTSFPLLDVSNGTNFQAAWFGCNSLTSFPLLDVSSGTNFRFAWRDCSSLISFPLLDVSSGTDFYNAWYNCTSLQNFPANMFDSVTATNFTDAFTNTNLTQTSIDNILVSIDTAGQSGGTFTQSGGSAPSAVGEAAIDNLRARGWTVTVTGGY